MENTQRSLTADLEKILGALASLFAHEGNAQIVAILTYSRASIREVDYDNWNGGTYGYEIHLESPAHFYVQIVEKQKQIEEVLKEKAQNITRLYENEYIRSFAIITELADDDGWREEAKAWMRGEGVNNQGRARSDNVAPLMSDGLLFRSRPEINLYRALKALGLSFAPLPVFIRGGETYRRIEPDFIIIKDGMILNVEVDGDTVHPESPREAHERLTMLVHEGVHVERVNSADCDTPEKAKQCAAKILGIITKLKANR